jgi:hypothetical protein
VCEGEWLSENDAMHNEIVHNESDDFFWREPIRCRESGVEPGLGGQTRDASMKRCDFSSEKRYGFFSLSEISFPKFEDSARRDVPR